MQRRTLDIIVSLGGLGLVILLVVGGFVLRDQGNFSKDYVQRELSDQQITFTAADKLTEADLAWTEARTGCTIKYAGELLTTGKQAECFANEYLGGHLAHMPTVDNPLTYSQIGAVQSDLRSQITIAKNAGNTDLAADLQKQVDSLTTTRDTVFKGEMLRGALLTTYGFSTLGERALLASTIAFGAAAVLLVLSGAGLVHAFVTPRSQAFAPVEEPKAGGVAGQAVKA
jgi:hypothetical protein